MQHLKTLQRRNICQLSEDFIIHLSKRKFFLTSPSQKCHVKLTFTAPNFYPHTVQRKSIKLSASAMPHKNMTSIFWKGSWWLWWNRKIHWGVQAGGLLIQEVSFLHKMHGTTCSFQVEIFPGASVHFSEHKCLEYLNNLVSSFLLFLTSYKRICVFLLPKTLQSSKSAEGGCWEQVLWWWFW